MPNDAGRKEKLVWRDQKQNSQLTEENRDEEDLINLVKPAKQLNHYTKPSHLLKSKLKTSQLFQQQNARTGQLKGSRVTPHAQQMQQPVQRSKFLTKTQHQTKASVDMQNSNQSKDSSQAELEGMQSDDRLKADPSGLQPMSGIDSLRQEAGHPAAFYPRPGQSMQEANRKLGKPGDELQMQIQKPFSHRP